MEIRPIADHRLSLLVLGSVTILLLLAFLECLANSSDSTLMILTTLLGIPALWFASKHAWRRTHYRIDVFSPVLGFPIAFILWFGFGSLTFLLEAYPPPYRVFIWALVCYLLGVFLVRNRPYRVTTEICPGHNLWGQSQFRTVIWGFFALMTTAYLSLVAQVGVPALHEDVAIRREALGEHHVLVLIVLSSAVTVTCFAAADLWSRNRILSPYTSAAMMIVSILMQGSFGNRGFLVAPILSLLLIWHYWRKPLPLKGLAAACTVLFVLSVVYDFKRADALRNSDSGATASEVVTSSSTFTLHTSLSNFRDIVEAIPSEVPYQDGVLTFGAILQVLPGHHESSDEFFKRILGNDFQGGGQPGTLLAPMYGDFGPTGIWVIMFLLGVFCARVHRWMKEKPLLIRVLLYSWLMQVVLFSLYSALLTYAITLWVPFMWWCLDRWMCPSPASVAEKRAREAGSLGFA